MIDVSDEILRALVAQANSAAAIAVKTGLNRKVVLRRVREGNLGPWIAGRSREMMQRPVPDDFHDRARSHGFNDNMGFYGCGYETLQRWYTETGLPKIRSKREKGQPAPKGFEDFAREHSQRETMRHFGISRDMVRTFEAQMKITRVRFMKTPTEGRGHAAKFIKVNAYQTAPVNRFQRDMSAAGQAADFLRKFGPVYRCDVRGKAIEDGFFWRRGSAILSDAELIERADWMRSKAA